MNKKAQAIYALVLLALGLEAHAIPIFYEVSGSVSGTTERGMRAPDEFRFGSTFTGTIWYDPDLAVLRPSTNTYSLALQYEFTFGNYKFHSNGGSSWPWISFGEDGFFAFDEIPRDNLSQIGPGWYAQELWFQSTGSHLSDLSSPPSSLPFGTLNLLHIWIWDEGPGTTGTPNFSFDAPFTVKEVPEPSTLGLFGLALIAVAVALHRRKS